MLQKYDVAVFIAHPDDERRLSGTIALLTNSGYRVLLISLTAGERGTHGTPMIRKNELTEAARVLGADVHFMKFRDTAIFDNRMSRHSVAQVIRKYKPEIVFASYHQGSGIHGISAHPDHRLTGELVTAAVTVAAFKKTDSQTRPHRVRHILYYMLPRTVQPNVYMAVSKKEMAQALRAAAEHKSQKKSYKGRKPFGEFLLSLREFSHLDVGLPLPSDCFLTEHFLCVPPLVLSGDGLRMLLPESSASLS